MASPGRAPLLGSLVARVCATTLAAAPGARAVQASELEWTPLAPAKVTASSGATFTNLFDGSILVSGAITPTDTYTLEVESLPRGVTAFRFDALPDESLPSKGPGRASIGNFVLSEIRLGTGPRGTRKPRPVVLQNATASFAQDHHPAGNAIDGVPGTGWAIHPKHGAEHFLVAETRGDLSLDSGVLSIELEFAFGDKHALGRFRVSVTTAPRPVRATGPRDDAEWGAVQGRINQAIDRGCEWLLGQQLLDGSWDPNQDTYRNGATALVTYALVKSGIPKRHPAIVRALEFMKGGNPRETYTLGCQILALHALNDPTVDAWIKQLAEQLVQFQAPSGGFHYGFQGDVDLSNAQYGALGLRAAALHGFRVDPEVWEKLAGYTVGLQEDSGGGPYGALGFIYRHPPQKATGSMTAAGVGVLAICDEQLKGRTTKHGNLAGLAKRGAEWLGQNYLVDTNPRSNGEWLYYYLYGVERVGALLQMRKLGEHDWYREGARSLVEHQAGDGKWEFAGSNHVTNTSWALLFLTRATAASSGKSTRSIKAYGGDDRTKPVSIRASGDTPLTFWISSWGDESRATLEWPGESGRGLRVKQVEWFATGFDGEPDEARLATVERDPGQPCGDERFGGQFAFELPGLYSIFARAHVLAPPATPGAPAGEMTLESLPLEVKVEEASDPELLRYARDSTRNLLLGQRLTITPSSTINDWWAPQHAVNGIVSRGWASKDDDPTPRLTIELDKPVRANLLQLLPAKVSDDRPSRIRRVNVTFNGKSPPLELVIEPRPDRKSRLRLPQAIVVRRIDLEVTEVSAPDAERKSVGLAEVELQMESAGKK